MLSFLIFADGCAASLIRADDRGLAMDSFQAILIPETTELIQWRIGDVGFDMELSGEVPTQLRRVLRESPDMLDPAHDVELWAVHPGGRTILDAVEDGLGLARDKLAISRNILRRFGD